MKNRYHYNGEVDPKDSFCKRLEDEDMVSFEISNGKKYWENVDVEDLYKEDLEEDLMEEMEMILNGTV